jgi:hypothetical protein
MTRIKLATGASGGSGTHAASHYGAREIESKLPSRYLGSNGKSVLAITFSFDDLPVASLDKANLSIPANAYIESVTLRVIDVFAGGTSYLIGLEEEDGSTIDADGISGAALILAEMDGVGDSVACTGALVGLLVGIGSAAGQVVVAATGTYTAGKAVLEITYKEFEARA